MVEVNDLPDELLLNVFLLLGVSDIALSVANVCIRWRMLAQDAVLWSKLEFVADKEMELSYVVKLLPRLSDLRRIKLQWRTDVSAIVETLCSCCPNLISLDLICCGFLNEHCIEQLLQYRDTLQMLSLGKSWATSSKCIDSIFLFKNLTELNLSHCKLMPDQFKSISVNCAKIVSLNIDFVRGITEEHLVTFLRLRETNLKSLTVFGELLTDNIFIHIEKCLALKLLHISTCRSFSDKCFKSVNKLLTLKSLTLRKAIRITSKALSTFYFESHIVKNLNYLYISAERIVSEEDISVWPKNNLTVDQYFVKHFCTCILTKEGFAIF